MQYHIGIICYLLLQVKHAAKDARSLLSLAKLDVLRWQLDPDTWVEVPGSSAAL